MERTNPIVQTKQDDKQDDSPIEVALLHTPAPRLESTRGSSLHKRLLTAAAPTNRSVERQTDRLRIVRLPELVGGISLQRIETYEKTTIGVGNHSILDREAWIGPHDGI